MFLTSEKINALCKSLCRTIDEESDKSKRAQCVIHERSMKLDRTPTSEGGRGMNALDISPEGVILFAFTTCGHSKAPCTSRVAIPLLVVGTDGTLIETAATKDLPYKLEKGESKIDIETLTHRLVDSTLIRASSVETHASIKAIAG